MTRDLSPSDFPVSRIANCCSGKDSCQRPTSFELTQATTSPTSSAHHELFPHRPCGSPSSPCRRPSSPPAKNLRRGRPRQGKTQRSRTRLLILTNPTRLTVIADQAEPCPPSPGMTTAVATSRIEIEHDTTELDPRHDGIAAN